MNKLRIIGLPFISGAAGAILVLALFGFMDKKYPDVVENSHYTRQINEKYRIFSLPLPESADFAGEQVPLEEWDIRERMDRELLVNTYWQSNTLLCIKRANRWFPVIEKILREQGVPEDFKYLAVIESGLTNAVSPSGATGFWQFLEATGKSYGLEINEEVDERYHVEKSTYAACRFLKESYQRFGSWTMAAAAYNMGAGGLGKQSERQQKESYWQLLLNDETSRYVFRILALKEILRNPDQYGFVVRPADLYEPLNSKEITVNTAIPDFAVFSHELEISYKSLKLHNPWLRQGYLNNKSGREYLVKIPVQE